MIVLRVYHDCAACIAAAVDVALGRGGCTGAAGRDGENKAENQFKNKLFHSNILFRMLKSL
jgi:hypothetical protein